MKRIPPRSVIYSRDVSNITGMCRRTALRILSRVRKAKNKSAKDLVTVDEFCEVMKMKVDVVREFIA